MPEVGVAGSNCEMSRRVRQWPSRPV